MIFQQDCKNAYVNNQVIKELNMTLRELSICIMAAQSSSIKDRIGLHPDLLKKFEELYPKYYNKFSRQWARKFPQLSKELKKINKEIFGKKKKGS